MVTSASKAASTPSFTTSISSSVLPKAATVASATAFAAALLLLSPLATGILDQVFTFAPKLFSILKYLKTLETVFVIRTGLSVGSEVISPLMMCGSSVNLTSAFVHKSTPNAAPLPNEIALTIVAAP